MAIEAFWSAKPDELIQALQSSPTGLTADRAAEEAAKLPKTKTQNLALLRISLFLGQFKSPIILILLFAAGVSAALGDPVTAGIIFAIVLASGALGFWQEFHAADAVKKLLALVQVTANVLRDGKAVEVPLSEVVPGDVFLLHAGDMIPADSRLLESTDLYANEAALTGEPFPVEKDVADLPAESQLSQRTNCVFLGTNVVSGTAKAIAVRVGKDTEFGKVSQSLARRPAETEFEHGVRRFGLMLMEVTMVLVLAMFAANVYFHKPVIESLLFSLAIAVGLTPQLLPAIISVNLAAGARRMAERKVIVKRLAAIENFGSMDVLCSDKTGTLTDGTVRLHDGVGLDGKSSERVKLFGLLNAAHQTGYSNPIDEAIVDAVKADIAGYEKVREQPYDFVRKRLTVVLKQDGKFIAVSKGAVSNILDVCTLVESGGGQAPIKPELAAIQVEFERVSKEGNRAIGIAIREFGADEPKGDCESDMTFLGMLLFFDPLRPEIVKTLDGLRKLGVRVKFVTGDNRYVAGAILQQAGVAKPKVLSGPEMLKLTDEAFRHVAGSVDIFAEVEPNQKARIVVTLQRAGHVVGHLGDGINDASAIHAADVGISVSNAVDVAKDAADIVLMEKDLGVLKDGIREGRITFANTLKYVFMATSANFGNMFSMAGASLFLKFLPMLPTQILLTNFMTDLPEMTIATDNVDVEWIDRPHRWDIRFITRFMVVFGLANSMCDYLTFAFLLFVLKANEIRFQTGWFIENVVTAALIVLVVRTRRPFWRSKPSRALAIATLASVAVVLAFPYSPLAPFLHLEPLPLNFLGMLAGLLVVYVVVAETAKYFFYRGMKH
ncbi:MAG TPA: magnesium-translocating P-type ATPase [Fimbriimonadaceae bacterium]|nr:magnesium-translocating P-type ATPase [Fimbriimonadaceae bacterium]